MTRPWLRIAAVSCHTTRAMCTRIFCRTRLDHDPEKLALGLVPRAVTGFRKRSCSKKKIRLRSDSALLNLTLGRFAARGSGTDRDQHEPTAFGRLRPLQDPLDRHRQGAGHADRRAVGAGQRLEL